MAVKKYYAVKKGLVPGIYESWEDCRKQVENYPNALYKSFKTKALALAYFNDKTIKSNKAKTTSNKMTNAYIEGIIKNSSETTVNAFVDGSYDKRTNRYSYGIYLITKDKRISIKEAFSDEEGLKYHNFSGEIRAAMDATRWAVQHNFDTINIFYDYIGIEAFASGKYKKTNNLLSETYVRFIKIYQAKIKMNFFKIKSHTNIKYNDKADELAKAALDL